jgi:hypothetical protein
LPQLPRLAIGAIVRNEGPYLLEWIAFHRVLGVERFFVADNGSTDEGPEILAGLDALGLVRLLPFPGRPDGGPQLPAYAAILRRHGGEADWIAFIDADEFLLPAAGLASLPALLAGPCADPLVGAVAVNWALYGSAGLLRTAPAPVIERFDRRAEQGRLANHHFKSVVRTAAGPAVGETPHAFRLLAPYRMVHADGSPVRPHPLGLSGLSAGVVWEPLRLNHYAVKSREEFLTRKLPRGRATTPGLRDPDYFRQHDWNDVRDPPDPALRAAAKREMRRLAGLLGLPDPVPEPVAIP